MTMLTIKLNGGSPWGFRMKGGDEFNLPISVEQLTPNGKAANGGLAVGDIILSCNGASFERILHANAKGKISSVVDTLILEISRPSGTNSPVNKQISTSSTQKTQAPSSVNNQTTNQSPTLNNSNNTTGSKAFGIGSPTIVTPHTSLASPAIPPSNPTSNPTSSVPMSSSAVSTSTTASNQPKDLQFSQNKTTPQEQKKEIPTSSQFQEVLSSPPFSAAANSEVNSQKTQILPTEESKKTNIQDNKGGKTCNTCNNDIGTSSFIRLDERIWHSEHFNCNNCNKNLVGVGFMQDGEKILCRDCYGAQKCPKCVSCSKPCISEYVEAANQSYHKECFVCTNCKKSLPGCAFNIHNGTPHCMDCVAKMCSQQCSQCQKPITPGQEYIEASSKIYHENCFLCSICNAPLATKQKYAIRNGQPCCPDHKP